MPEQTPESTLEGWVRERIQAGVPKAEIRANLTHFGAIDEAGILNDEVLAAPPDPARMAEWKRAEAAKQTPVEGGVRIEFPDRSIEARDRIVKMTGNLPDAAADVVLQQEDEDTAIAARDVFAFVHDNDLMNLEDPNNVRSLVQDPRVLRQVLKENEERDLPFEAIKRIAIPVARLAGVPVGAIDAAAESVREDIIGWLNPQFKRRYTTSPEGYVLDEPPGPSTIAQIYKMTEEDLQNRLQAAMMLQDYVREQSAKAGVPSVLAVPEGTAAAFLDDLRTDLADNVNALLEIGGFAIGLKVPEEDLQKSTWDAAVAAFHDGTEMGKTLVGGAVGGVGALLANPREAIQTRPVSVALIAYSLLRPAKLAGQKLSPHLENLYAKVKRVADAVSQKTGADAAAGVAIRTLYGGKRPPPKEIRAAAVRVVADPMRQGTGDATEAMVRLIKDPEDFHAEVAGIANQMARAIKRGEYTEGEVFGPVERRPGVAVQPETAAEKALRSKLDQLQTMEKQTHKEQGQARMALQRHVRRIEVEQRRATAPEVKELRRAMSDTRAEIRRMQTEIAEVAEQAQDIIAQEGPKPPPEIVKDLVALQEAEAELAGRIREARGFLADMEASLGEAELGAELPEGHSYLRIAQRMSDEVEVLAARKAAILKAADKVVADLKTAREQAPWVDVPVGERIDAAVTGRKVRPEGLSIREEINLANVGARTALQRFRALEQVWKTAATHEVPEVKTAIAERLGQIDAIRKKLQTEVAEIDVLHRERALLPAEQRETFYKQHGEAFANEAKKRAQLADFDAAYERGTEILKRPDTVKDRPGRPTEEVTIGVEQVVRKGQKELSAAEKAAQDLYAEPEVRRAAAREFVTPEEIERDPALASAGAIVQRQRATVTPVETEALLTNPTFARLAGRMVEVIGQTFRPADLIRKVPGDAPGLRILQQELARGRTGFLNEADVLQIIARGVKSTSAQQFRSPKLRAEMVRRIRSRYPELSAEGLEAELVRMGEGHFLDKPLDYIKTLEDGRKVSLYQEMLDTMAAHPEIVREVAAEATIRLGIELGNAAEQARFHHGIIQEVQRFGFDKLPLGEVTLNIVDRVLIDGEPPAQILLRKENSASRIAALLRSNEDFYAARIKEATGISDVAARRRLVELASDLRNSYEPPMEALRARLPEGVETRQFLGDTAGRLKPSEAPIRGAVTQVRKGFNSSAGWYFRSMDEVARSDLWGVLSRAMKLKLTVENFGAHIHNVTSNNILEAVKTGKTPMGVLKDWAETQWLWKQYRDGTIVDPDLVGILEGIERSKLVDTTAVHAEIGSLERPVGLGGIGKAVATVGEPYRIYQKVMGEAYQLEDNIPKLNRAIRDAVRVRDNIRLLRPGRGVEYEIGPRRVMRVVRTPDGGFDIKVRGRWQTVDKGVSVPEERLPHLLAKVGVNTAQNLFFDYGDVANYISMIRGTPAVNLAFTQFPTWAHKALDIPGLKKGLLARALEGDAPMPTWTDDPAIGWQVAKEAVGISARRAMMHGALRAQLLDRPENEARKVLKFLPKEVGIGVLDAATHPGYIGFIDGERANPFEPVDAFMRVGLGVGLQAWMALDPNYAMDALYPPTPEGAKFKKDEFEGYPPEVERQVRMRRALWMKNAGNELWSADDVLSLLHLTGHPITQAIQGTLEDSRRGRAFNEKAFWRNFGGLLIGALPHRVLDVTVAEMNEFSPWSSRFMAIREEGDPLKTEEKAQWIIRKIVGKGWRYMDVEAGGDAYFRKVKTAIRSSLLTEKATELKKREAKLDQMDLSNADWKAVRNLIGLRRKANRAPEGPSSALQAQIKQAEAEISSKAWEAIPLIEDTEAYENTVDTITDAIEEEIDRMKDEYNEVAERKLLKEAR